MLVGWCRQQPVHLHGGCGKDQQTVQSTEVHVTAVHGCSPNCIQLQAECCSSCPNCTQLLEPGAAAAEPLRMHRSLLLLLLHQHPVQTGVPLHVQLLRLFDSHSQPLKRPP